MSGYLTAIFAHVEDLTDVEVPDNFTGYEIDPDYYDDLRAEALQFYRIAEDLIDKGDPAHSPDHNAGIEFWLSRNGSGTGFWDSEAYPEGVAEQLEAIAEKFGSLSADADDNGKIYFMDAKKVPTEEPMLDEWKRQYSEQYQKWSYYNPDTGKWQWEEPPASASLGGLLDEGDDIVMASKNPFHVTAQVDYKVGDWIYVKPTEYLGEVDGVPYRRPAQIIELNVDIGFDDQNYHKVRFEDGTESLIEFREMHPTSEEEISTGGGAEDSGDIVMAMKNPFHVEAQAHTGPQTGAKFKRGDKAYLTVGKESKMFLTGQEVTVVSDAQAAGGAWKYLVQRPGKASQPILEKHLTNVKPKFKEGDRVSDPYDEYANVGQIVWNDFHQAWTYEIDYDDGTTKEWDADDLELSVPTGSVSNPKKKQKQKEWPVKQLDQVQIIGEHEAAGHTGQVTSVNPKTGEASVEVNNNGKWESYAVNQDEMKVVLRPEQEKKQKTVFKIGDHVRTTQDMHAGKYGDIFEGSTGVVTKAAEGQFAHDSGRNTFVQLDDRPDIDIPLVFSNQELELVWSADEKQKEIKFKRGEEVIVSTQSGVQAGVIDHTYNGQVLDDDDNMIFRVMFPDGNRGDFTETKIRPAAEPAPQQKGPSSLEQKQQQNQMEQMHPSVQQLNPPRFDQNTPYFPPGPEGRKQFEEFLIKQHNDFFEDLKKTWSKLIKTQGKKGKMIARKQMDALYVHAMRFAKKDK
jgi:ribosomal protein L21E